MGRPIVPMSGSATTPLAHAWASLAVLAIRVAGVALQMAMLVLLSHLLPPETFGVYATAYALLAVVRVVGPLGFDQLALQGLFGHSSAEPPANRFGDAFVFLMFINAGCAVIIGGGAHLFATEPLATSFAIVAAGLPAVSTAGLAACIIRSYDHSMLAQLPESVGLPVLVLLLVGAEAWFGPTTLTWCVIALAISAWVVLLAYLVILTRLTPLTSLIGAPWRAFGLARTAASFIGALVMTAFASRLPIFLAAIVLGPAHAATVEVASRFGSIGSIITSSIATTFSPRYARAHAHADRAEAGQLVRFSSLLAGGGVTLLCLALIFVFPFLPGRILPEFYENAYALLVCCCIGTAINATFGLSSNYLMMAGRPNVVMLLSASQLLAIVAAGVALAQEFGPVGIGIALIFGAIIRDGGAALVVCRSLKGDRR